MEPAFAVGMVSAMTAVAAHVATMAASTAGILRWFMGWASEIVVYGKLSLPEAQETRHHGQLALGPERL